LTLILVFIAAVAQALQVPHSLRQYFLSFQKPEVAISKEIPVQNSAPVTAPPTSRLPVRKPGVCADWRSENSPRQYSFVCVGAETFDVYEVNNGQLNKIGSGHFGDDTVDAEVVSPSKHRKGYWQLKLSADKTILEGTWRGDDPREAGNLKLRKMA
jgi:hypothetical protein